MFHALDTFNVSILFFIKKTGFAASTDGTRREGERVDTFTEYCYFGHKTVSCFYQFVLL